jgi:ABC-type transporter Mla MlaB component
VNHSTSALLRITVKEAPDAMTLRLEGRVSGAMSEELRQTWSGLAPKLRGRTLNVDLRDAIYIDQAGLAVLSDIHDQTGANFEAGSPLTQYFADQAMRIQEQTLKGA